MITAAIASVEALGVIVAGLLTLIMGIKKALSIAYLITAISVGGLFATEEGIGLILDNKIYVTVSILLALCSVSIINTIVYLVMSKTFSNNHLGISFGICSCFSKLIALLSPLV